MINEKTLYDGVFEIKIKDKLTGEVKTEEVHNRMMNMALQELVKPLTGTAANLEIKYLALGTGSTAVTDNDAALATEIFRTPDTFLSANATGQVTSEFVVLDSEATGNITEIGIFGGTSATLTANVGICISRILWTHTKTDSEEITFRRIDVLTRG
jgi:hypothetical protein